MTCACCGRDTTPAWCVPTKPRERKVLCEACRAKWVDSPAARLCEQARVLGRWDVAGSQFLSWKAVEAGRTT
jgi:hypothetical protein